MTHSKRGWHRGGEMPDWIRKKISDTKRVGYAAINPELTLENKVCETCGKIIPRPINTSTGYPVSWVAYRKKRFCSTQCHWDSRQGHVDVECDWCGVSFRIRKARYEKTKGKTFYCSWECRRESGNGGPGLRGENHPQWKGGTTAENRKLRHTRIYAQWRKSVYRRDNWTCQRCHRKVKDIVAHHIKSFWTYLDLRYDVDNGQTLCRSCHKKVHKEIGQATRFKSGK